MRGVPRQVDSYTFEAVIILNAHYKHHRAKAQCHLVLVTVGEIKGDSRAERTGRGALHFHLLDAGLVLDFLLDADLRFPLRDPLWDHSSTFEDQKTAAENSQVLFETVYTGHDFVFSILFGIHQDLVESPSEWSEVLELIQVQGDAYLIQLSIECWFN